MVKQNKIWQPGDTAAIDELAEELRQETIMMAKKIAKKHGCEPEDIAFSVTNVDGIIHAYIMTPEERAEKEAQEAEEKRIRLIKKDRGVFNA